MAGKFTCAVSWQSHLDLQAINVKESSHTFHASSFSEKSRKKIDKVKKRKDNFPSNNKLPRILPLAMSNIPSLALRWCAWAQYTWTPVVSVIVPWINKLSRDEQPCDLLLAILSLYSWRKVHWYMQKENLNTLNLTLQKIINDGSLRSASFHSLFTRDLAAPQPFL